MKKRIFAVLTVLCLVATMFVVMVLPVSAADSLSGLFLGMYSSALPSFFDSPFSISAGVMWQKANNDLGYFDSQYETDVVLVMDSSVPLDFASMYFANIYTGSAYTRCDLNLLYGTNLYYRLITFEEWRGLVAAVSPNRCTVYAQSSSDGSVSAGILPFDEFVNFLSERYIPDPVLNDSSLGVLNNLSSVQIYLSDADELSDREVSLPLIRSTFGGFALRPVEYNSDFYQYNSAVYDFNFSEPFDFLSLPFYVTGQSYEMTATVFDVNGNQYAAHFALDDPSVRRGTLLLNDSSLSLPYLMTDHIRIEFSNPEDYAFGQYIIADGSQATFRAGYTSGYNDGSGDGYLTGYAEGQLHPTDDVLFEYTESVRDDIAFEAFERGKQQGIATKVDFPGLIFAVVDTPIQVISNVLNFDIFGYNMSYFFFGLLTLALFAALLRRIL